MGEEFEAGLGRLLVSEILRLPNNDFCTKAKKVYKC